MWTKHFTADGKVFYFNAAVNRSVWSPPNDAVIHEAPNAKPPSQSELINSNDNFHPLCADIPPQQHYSYLDQSQNIIAAPIGHGNSTIVAATAVTPSTYANQSQNSKNINISSLDVHTKQM